MSRVLVVVGTVVVIGVVVCVCVVLRKSIKRACKRMWAFLIRANDKSNEIVRDVGIRINRKYGEHTPSKQIEAHVVNNTTALGDISKVMDQDPEFAIQLAELLVKRNTK